MRRRDRFLTGAALIGNPAPALLPSSAPPNPNQIVLVITSNMRCGDSLSVVATLRRAVSQRDSIERVVSLKGRMSWLRIDCRELMMSVVASR